MLLPTQAPERPKKALGWG